MLRFLAPKPLSDAQETTTRIPNVDQKLGLAPSPENGAGTVDAGSTLTSRAEDLFSDEASPRPSTPPDESAQENSKEPKNAPTQTGSSYNKEEHPQEEVPSIRSEDSVSPELLESLAEEVLSEEQLRKLFEDEEIERFLRLFNAHVKEVRLPATRAPPGVSETEGVNVATVVLDEPQRGVLLPGAESTPVTFLKSGPSIDQVENGQDSPWSMVDLSSEKERGTVKPPEPLGSLTLSENIARKYILPILPPLQPNLDYRFTIGRARLQVERLNLVTLPVYGPFFVRMWGYASWNDRQTSARYCTIFWALWYFNMLLPTLFAIILYALFSRRIFSYPTLEELRDRRKEAARAQVLGEEVENRFVAGPNFGVRDAWSLFRNFTKGKKKSQRKKKSLDKGEAVPEVTESPMAEQILTERDGNVTKADAQAESQAEKDIKRAALRAMTEIADLHERIKNIFLWRRPHVSRNYAMGLAILVLVTLILPAKYLAKLAYFLGGTLFWFVPPVILGIPSEDRARLPSPFADAPTDAQYAMDLIALRVARGESVVPANLKKTKQKKDFKTDPNDPISTLQDQDDDEKQVKDREVDWSKWGERAARGFALAEEGKRVLKGTVPFRQGTSNQPLSEAHSPQNTEETSTYPAQYQSGPGLLVLTATTLSFTQVLSSKPKLQISLDHIRGVKKTGKMGGLTLKWGEGDGDEKEEKFWWVGGRDEVFAKLVGWRGREWIQM